MTEREQERAAVVAWLRSEAIIARAELAGYRGSGLTTEALCAGERIIALSSAAAEIERGDHIGKE